MIEQVIRSRPFWILTDWGALCVPRPCQAELDLRVRLVDNSEYDARKANFSLAPLRKRDTEATLMNATIHQWRYGQAYGDGLFANTAANIDSWRPF